MSATKKMWQERSSAIGKFTKRSARASLSCIGSFLGFFFGWLNPRRLQELFESLMDNILGFFLVMIMIGCIVFGVIGASVGVVVMTYKWATLDNPASMSDVTDASKNACVKPILHSKLAGNSNYLITNRDITEATIACQPSKRDISNRQKDLLSP